MLQCPAFFPRCIHLYGYGHKITVRIQFESCTNIYHIWFDLGVCFSTTLTSLTTQLCSILIFTHFVHGIPFGNLHLTLNRAQNNFSEQRTHHFIDWKRYCEKGHHVYSNIFQLIHEHISNDTQCVYQVTREMSWDLRASQFNIINKANNESSMKKRSIFVIFHLCKKNSPFNVLS